MFALLVIVLIVALLGARHIVKWARFVILARKLPSPKTVPFIGNFKLIAASHNDLEKIISQYFQECPRFYTVWLGPFPMMFVRDPRDVEIILGSWLKNVKKSLIYDFARPLMGDGLSIAKVEKWEKHRKLLNPAFHIKVLENFIQVLARKSEILVQKLEKEVGQNSFEVNAYICRASIDAVLESIFEKESKCLDEDEDKKFADDIEMSSKLMLRRVFSPWLYPDIIYWHTSDGKECMKAVEDLTKELQEIIDYKRQKIQVNSESKQSTAEDEVLGEKKRPTFLELLLGASEYGVKLSAEDVMDEIKTFLLAGFDTVRITLDWALQILGNHPEIQDKIYEELENILQGTDRSHTMNDLNEMKYLERVIKEVLRLYPPLPFMSTEAIRDIDIDGYTIPAGMMINIPIYHIHRNSDVYPNPEEFDPDRFLPQSLNRHPYAYIPFGAGPRNCIGKKYAMLIIKMLLSYIIRNYKIHSTRETLTPILEIILTSEEGFHISIEKRNPKNAK